MIIFISPAKGFKETDRKGESLPVFLDNAKEIMGVLKDFSVEDISKAMKVKENIALLNKERFSDFRFDSCGLAALASYDGMQYKNIDADSFDSGDFEFAEKHLRILSALYGVLKPDDSIYPYRLDFLTKISVGDAGSLYGYWKDMIYKELSKDSNGVIVNLASDEYSKAVKKYINGERYISCVFKVEKNGAYKVQSTASKKARGMMVNFIVKNRIDDPERLKEFSGGGYRYCEDMSCEDQWVFVLDEK